MPKLIFSCRFSKINQDVIAQLINTNQYQTDLNFVFIGFLFNFIYQKVHNYSALMENAFFAKKGKQLFFYYKNFQNLHNGKPSAKSLLWVAKIAKSPAIP